MKTSETLQKAVAKYRKGNEAGFNELYQGSYGYLYTCIKHIVQQEELTLDMLQETYLEISKSIGQLEKTENFLNWAAMIANRKCYAYLKKQNVLQVVQAEEEFLENVVEDEAFIPEEILQNQEKQRLMREIIDGLSAEQRLCIMGYYYNEMKQEDMAREFDMPLNTVKTHLRRAKEEIKKKVIDLDKKQGTRLYSLAPFLVLFFNLEAEACTPLPLESVMKTEVNGMKSASKKAMKTSTKVKALIGGIILTTTVGVGISHVANQRDVLNPVESSIMMGEEASGEDVAEEDPKPEEQVIQKPEEEIDEVPEEVHLYDGVTPLAISGIYDSYGNANAGVIPVCKDGKWGLVTYDNEILVPLEYEVACGIPNDEGQTFFGNPGDYRVFDKEGKELFRTEIPITAVSEGVVLTEGEDEHGYFLEYHTLDGTLLYKTEWWNSGWATLPSECCSAVGFSEGYGMFSDSTECRVDKSGSVHSIFETYYAEEIARIEEINAGSTAIGDGAVGVTSVVGLAPAEHPLAIGAVSQGYYVAKSRSIWEYGDQYGKYNCFFLYDVDGTTRYTLGVGSVYKRAGYRYSESDFGWKMHGYYDNGVGKYNYDTLVTIRLNKADNPVSYLIDMTKLEQKTQEEYAASYEYANERFVDFDWSPIPDEAIVAEADNMRINGEKYWLIGKDGKWGYIDHAGNVMGMYQDAAEFNEGKAVVIEDGIAYWIDESFEKILEIGPAESAVTNGDVVCITYEDGSEVYLSYK